VDIDLIYGMLTAATAISAGFAGAHAARLSKNVSEKGVAIQNTSATGAEEINRMRQNMAEVISERYAGAQNASAWLATSTALFGVASTRPILDAIGIAFMLIGIVLAAVAVQAIQKANAATELLNARVSFEQWYLPWIYARNLDGARPIDEEVAFAFAAVNKGCAATLRRFEAWPFHFVYREEAIHISRSPHIR
jgi:hypothetical protein